MKRYGRIILSQRKVLTIHLLGSIAECNEGPESDDFATNDSHAGQPDGKDGTDRDGRSGGGGGDQNEADMGNAGFSGSAHQAHSLSVTKNVMRRLDEGQPSNCELTESALANHSRRLLEEQWFPQLRYV